MLALVGHDGFIERVWSAERRPMHYLAAHSLESRAQVRRHIHVLTGSNVTRKPLIQKA
jgi:hypothetical protein